MPLQLTPPTASNLIKLLFVRDAELCSENAALAIRGIFVVKCSYFQHLLVCQLGSVMRLSVSITASIFRNTVVNVYLRGAKKKVCRINATRIVALMKNLKLIWNISIGIFKAEAMAHFSFAVSFHLAIPRFINTALPFPTFAKLRAMWWNGSVLVYLYPEAFPKCFFELLAASVSGTLKNLLSLRQCRIPAYFYSPLYLLRRPSVIFHPASMPERLMERKLRI